MVKGPKSSLSFWISQRSCVSSTAESAASTLNDLGTAACSSAGARELRPALGGGAGACGTGARGGGGCSAAVAAARGVAGGGGRAAACVSSGTGALGAAAARSPASVAALGVGPRIAAAALQRLLERLRVGVALARAPLTQASIDGESTARRHAGRRPTLGRSNDAAGVRPVSSSNRMTPTRVDVGARVGRVRRASSSRAPARPRPARPPARGSCRDTRERARQARSRCSFTRPADVDGAHRPSRAFDARLRHRRA